LQEPVDPSSNVPHESFSFTAVQSGPLYVHVDALFFAWVAVFDGCGAGAREIACDVDPDLEDPSAGIVIDATAGTTYVVVLGSPITGPLASSASFAVGLTAGETCDNGADDNGDGAVDCIDPQCRRNPVPP
jgi:hypothetical protein